MSKKDMGYVGKEVEITVSFRGDKKFRGMVVDSDLNSIYFASNVEEFSGYYDYKAKDTKYPYCWCLSESVVTIELIDTNEMPELKAGMIVESKGKFGIVLPKGFEEGSSIYDITGGNSSIELIEVTTIYYKDSRTYKPLFEGEVDTDTLKLVWTKKSEADNKIKELEKTVQDALDQIQELKETK